MSTTQTTRKIEFRPSIPRRLRPIQDQGGSGTGYQRTFPRIALGAALLGAKATDLAALFSVTEPTIYAWRKAHPAFDKAIREGGVYADAQVAASLYKRCIGGMQTTTTVEKRVHRDGEGNLLSTVEIVITETKDVPPDATACWRWLQRRRGWGLEQPVLTVEDVLRLSRAAQEEALRRGFSFRTPEYRAGFADALERSQRRAINRCPECGGIIVDAMPDEDAPATL
jgi:hypothetical protein